MQSVIDLGSEVLVDRSKVRLPQLRLLLEAIGKPILKGSAWVAIDKQIAEAYRLLKRARPEVTIYVYGSNLPIDLDFEVVNLGLMLDLEALAELYARCKVGLCISASNPSIMSWVTSDSPGFRRSRRSGLVARSAPTTNSSRWRRRMRTAVRG